MSMSQYQEKKLVLRGKIKLNFIDLKQLRLDGPNLKLKQL
jgi:hypothetical protein